MTKELPTWKDRFDIEFSNRGFAPGSKEQYLAFIEQEIIEAEKRGEQRGTQKGREEMREWIAQNRNTVTLVQIEEYLSRK